MAFPLLKPIAKVLPFFEITNSRTPSQAAFSNQSSGPYAYTPTSVWMINKLPPLIHSIRRKFPFPQVFNRVNCPAVSDVIAPPRLGIIRVGVGVIVLVAEGWTVIVGERVGAAAKDGVGETTGVSPCETTVKVEFAADSGLHAVHKNMPRTQKRGDGIFMAVPPVSYEYDGG